MTTNVEDGEIYTGVVEEKKDVELKDEQDKISKKKKEKVK